MSEAHPFEVSGCGIGPFKFVAMATIPSPSLGEHNPTAHRNAMLALPKLDGGCGTCRHCGHAIMNICIIRDSTGRIFGVGTDCVEKTGDSHLGDAARIAQARLRRRIAADKRDAKQAEWMSSPEFKSQQEAAQAKREAQDAAKALKVAAVLAKWAFLLPTLEKHDGGFCASILNDLENGFEPRGRALAILCDIFGKAHGRRNSPAFNDAVDQFAESVENNED